MVEDRMVVTVAGIDVVIFSSVQEPDEMDDEGFDLEGHVEVFSEPTAEPKAPVGCQYGCS